MSPTGSFYAFIIANKIILGKEIYIFIYIYSQAKMKILFICTGNNFTTNMLYKENYFIKAAVNLGYEVSVFASQYEYKKGVSSITNINTEFIDGYTLTRYPYNTFLFSKYLTNKIRYVASMKQDIISYSPDFIFFNCPQVMNINELRYIKQNLPKCKIAFDFSTKYINSARNFLSLHVLHKIIYKYWIHNALPYVDRIFYVSSETKEFIKEVYAIPDNILSENGLPGEVVSEEFKRYSRKRIINKYNLPQDVILFVHSGKIGILKRTVELLEAFSKVNDKRFRLIIAGSLDNNVRDKILSLIQKDSRVIFTGFLTGEELTELLCSADMYLQPGTISQTSQTAICCGTPIMFMKCPTNEDIFSNNGFILDNLSQLYDTLSYISHHSTILKNMSHNSYELARNKLDYMVLFKKALIESGIIIKN